jgi:ubiquinone/menaquinone biosynthesis C-methylase UbiE
MEGVAGVIKHEIVELGGGSNPRYHPNIDVRQEPGVDIVADISEKLPLEDGSCANVYSAYAIEHISWRKVKNFISELHRILAPGGKANIITANLKAQAQKIASKEVWTDDEVCMIFGGLDYAENAHKCGFSPESAIRMFKEAGFQRVEWSEVNCPTDMVISAEKAHEVSVSTGMDVKAHWATERYTDDAYVHWSRPYEYGWALTRLATNGYILNIGGAGDMCTVALSRQGHTVVDMDNSLNKVEDVKKNCPGVIAVHGDASSIPYQDGTFDAVLCLSVVEHAPPDHGRYLSEMWRVIKPGGQLLLTFDVVDKPFCNQFVDEDAAKRILMFFGLEMPAKPADGLVSTSTQVGLINSCDEHGVPHPVRVMCVNARKPK